MTSVKWRNDHKDHKDLNDTKDNHLYFLSLWSLWSLRSFVSFLHYGSSFILFKMHRDFALFSSAVDLAHHYWKQLLQPGDCVIDATCGNGKDTLVLAKLIGEEGVLIGIDIQAEALARTRALLEEQLPAKQMAKIHLFLQSHADFPPISHEKKIKLIIYNLGYLPGGNKEITSKVGSTLESVKKSLTILAPFGVISIACYPGHPEGAREEEALIQLLATLPSSQWSVCHHRWQNRLLSPSLILIQKK